MEKKVRHSNENIELELEPSTDDKSLSIEETYDGGFHILRKPTFDGRPASKRSGLQAFTC